MSFNINQFKAELNTRGVLRSHSFVVRVQPPVAGLSMRVLSLRTEQMSMPGVSFMTSDNVKQYGYGPIYKRPYNAIQSDISCSHIMDKAADLYTTFSDWMNQIVQFKRSQGVMNQGDYFMSFPDEYRTDIEIDVFESAGKKSKIIRLHEAYPVAMDPIQLSWNQTDDLAKLTVTYTFTDWNIITLTESRATPTNPLGLTEGQGL